MEPLTTDEMDKFTNFMKIADPDQVPSTKKKEELAELYKSFSGVVSTEQQNAEQARKIFEEMLRRPNDARDEMLEQAKDEAVAALQKSIQATGIH